MPTIRRPKAQPRNLYITRTETLDGSTRGWNVRLPLRRPGTAGGKRGAAVRHSRFFADRKHGGKLKALKVAREFRDQAMREHPPGPSHSSPVGRKTPRNTSGIVGVRRGVYEDGVEGHMPYAFWSASWPNGRGGVRFRSFSVALYGEKDAKKLAVMARKEGVDELRIERGGDC